MKYTVRQFNPTDEEYAAIVAVYNAVWSDERQFPPELWREEDDEWPPDSLHQRFVAEQDGLIIGLGACFEKYWQFQPGTVHVEFHVHPDYVGNGIDKMLYEYILSYLSSQNISPDVIATDAREDHPEQMRFLQERGFESTMRFPKASLAIAEFDKTRFKGLFEDIAGQRIEILTLAAVCERYPDWKEWLWALRWAIMQDVPAVEPPTRPTLAEFEKMILDDPALCEEAWFVAVDDSQVSLAETGSFVGMSNLWLNDPRRKRLDTGLTGVLRAYRRRGLATALKVCTIAFAQGIGANTIETENEENNPMYDLNLKLGFKPKAAWVSYCKSVLSFG